MTTPGIAGMVGIVMFIAGWWGGAEWQQREPTPIAAVLARKPVGCQATWLDRSNPEVWLQWVFVTTSGKVIGEVSKGPSVSVGTYWAVRGDGTRLSQYINLDGAKRAVEEDESVKRLCHEP